jgi:hypothetical protein
MASMKNRDQERGAARPQEGAQPQRVPGPVSGRGLMRLKRDLVIERETFAVELFKTDPTMTGLLANEHIKAAFGQYMRRPRLYTIRRTTLAQLATLQEPNGNPSS